MIYLYGVIIRKNNIGVRARLYMKKSLFASAVLLASLVILGGCGNNNASSESKLKAENSSLKQEVKSMKQKLKDERNTKVTAAIEEAGGSADDVDSDDSSSSSDSNKKYAKATVGEEYVFKNKKGEKLAGITLLSVDRNFGSEGTEDLEDIPENFADNKPENVVAVKLKYTNYSLDYLDPYNDISLYDDEGNQGHLNDYPENNDEVSAGHSGTAIFYYILDKPYANSKSFEVEFSSDFDLDDSTNYYQAKWSVSK